MKRSVSGANLLAVFFAAFWWRAVGAAADAGRDRRPIEDAPLADGRAECDRAEGGQRRRLSTVVQVALGAKISETRINRTVYEYVYRLSVTNGARPAQGLLANLTGGGTGLVGGPGCGLRRRWLSGCDRRSRWNYHVSPGQDLRL